MTVKLEASWLAVLKDEFEKDYMKNLKVFLVEEQKNNVVYPPNSEIFSAFEHTPFDKVRVVILGQDPYHGPGEAHGLSFSVKKGIRIPPSLRNIYKELQSDLGIEPPNHGHLIEWAQQGVLLLNSVLTVRHKTANSHQKQGWETLTDQAIKKLSDNRENIVFILWGSKAKAKSELIDQSKHHIITSAHPSPLAVRYGFFGSKPFSKTNAFLNSIGETPIDWSISS
jgi:uracil-DNA glycosylase